MQKCYWLKLYNYFSFNSTKSFPPLPSSDFDNDDKANDHYRINCLQSSLPLTFQFRSDLIIIKLIVKSWTCFLRHSALRNYYKDIHREFRETKIYNATNISSITQDWLDQDMRYNINKKPRALSVKFSGCSYCTEHTIYLIFGQYWWSSGWKQIKRSTDNI